MKNGLVSAGSGTPAGKTAIPPCGKRAGGFPGGREAVHVLR